MASHTDTASNLLTSWKGIALYMGKGVRTVQRWEKDFGLPVRRPNGSDKKAVLARTSDIDAWVALRCSTRVEARPRDGSPEMLFAGNSSDAPVAIPRARPNPAVAELSLHIEASRALREDNRALRKELSVAVRQLKQQIFSLHLNN